MMVSACLDDINPFDFLEVPVLEGHACYPQLTALMKRGNRWTFS